MTNIDIDNLPDLLTPKETADLLRISTLTLKRWAKDKRIPFLRVSRRGDRRFRKEEILSFIEKGFPEPQPIKRVKKPVAEQVMGRKFTTKFIEL